MCDVGDEQGTHNEDRRWKGVSLASGADNISGFNPSRSLTGHIIDWHEGVWGVNANRGAFVSRRSLLPICKKLLSYRAPSRLAAFASFDPLQSGLGH